MVKVSLHYNRLVINSRRTFIKQGSTHCERGLTENLTHRATADVDLWSESVVRRGLEVPGSARLSLETC